MQITQRIARAAIVNLLMLLLVASTGSSLAADKTKPMLIIHGGAGIEKGELTAEDEKRCHAALQQALTSGHAVLIKGGRAVEAVEAAITCMEDSKLFNAGAGAVFNHEGQNRLDAAIMDGRTREAGAVADASGVKNPILAAAAVMRKTKNVLLVGEGANNFVRGEGLEMRPPEYFFTQKRWDELQKKRGADNAPISTGSYENQVPLAHKFGTVGAVALDEYGDLAAGTSTGGLTDKRWGRVGDSPIIGAGTFADNDSCAVSCTGEGEWFIRFNVASDVAARVKYQGKTVSKASEEVIHGVLDKDHGEGGLIVLDRRGNFAMPFNSQGMYRGYIKDGQPHTFIH